MPLTQGTKESRVKFAENANRKSQSTSVPNVFQTALWKDVDNDYPVNKAVIGGVAYNQSRLRALISEKLATLSFDDQMIIVERVREKFKERRPLESYLKSNSVFGKTAEQRKSASVAHFIDDIIIDHDLFAKGGYPVLAFLMQLFVHNPTNVEGSYKEPWQMQQSEFVAYVEDYIKRFHSYPVEIIEMFDTIVRLFPGNENLLNESPAPESGSRISKIAHLLHVTRALLKGLEVSQEVRKEYPWIDNMRSGKIIKRHDWKQYGYDTTNFNSPEVFQNLLDLLDIHRSWKECRLLDKSNFGIPLFLWESEHISIITASNPLTNNGYASFINVEGSLEKVLTAVEYIDKNTNSKGTAESKYINFDNMICMDPDGLGEGTPGISPSPQASIKDEIRPANTTELESLSRFLKQFTSGINADTNEGKAKESFEKLGIKGFKELAKFLKLKPYEVNYFKAGNDSSGELVLSGMLNDERGVRISFSKDGSGKVHFNSIKNLNDVKGGKNQFFLENELNSPGYIEYLIHKRLQIRKSPGPLEIEDEATPDIPTNHAPQFSTSDIVYAKPKHRFSEVIEVPRDLITVRPKMFQGRETDFAKETVDKIVREGFDKSQEPIVVWKSPVDEKLVVISGHSRWEASRLLYEAGDKSLGMMPVKIHKGTLQEAMDYALLESNRGVTQEGLKSDLRAYKYAKKKGFNREYLQGIFKPESRLKLLEDISYLNESGSFLNYLDTDAEKSFPYLQRNAHWVGLIRKQYSALSDSHEEEMFKYLYGLNDAAKKGATKKLAINKGQFFDLIEKKVSRIDFSPNKPLNLDHVVSTSALTDPAKERIHEIEREISKLEQERLEKDELIVRAMKEEKSSLVEKFRERQSEINQIITHKIIEKQKIEHEIGVLERTTVDLFSGVENLSESSTGSNEHKSRPAAAINSHKSLDPLEDYLDRVIAILQEKYEKGERPTKKQIELVGKELGIENRGQLWEAAELSWLKWYKALYLDSGSFQSRLNRMIRFWNNVQPTYDYSDTSKEIYKQYSTPGPIAAIVAEYTKMREAKSVFEPSAGNGLFIIGANPSLTHVNEIDSTRLHSLQFQGFKKITTYNATQPFPDEMTEAYDVMVTNPPFMKWEEEQYDKDNLVRRYFNNHLGLNHHMRLEQVMAGLALKCLKDNGRAAIILLGHIYFSSDGYIAKYRPFFNWLYRHYTVDDIINLNSFKLFNKQGAVEKTMLILIAGRKPRPQGVAPTKNERPQLAEMVDSFDELWDRVKRHIGDSIDKVILQLQTELAA